MTDLEKAIDRTVADLADHKSGDDGDPYEDQSITDLPAWWQDAIREYDEFDVRTFRPSRFEDGVVVQSHLCRLEAEHDVDVSLFSDGVAYGDPWTLAVDGQPVTDIAHRRSPDGYSVFETTSGWVADLVAAHASSSE